MGLRCYEGKGGEKKGRMRSSGVESRRGKQYIRMNRERIKAKKSAKEEHRRSRGKKAWKSRANKRVERKSRRGKQYRRMNRGYRQRRVEERRIIQKK